MRSPSSGFPVKTSPRRTHAARLLPWGMGLLLAATGGAQDDGLLDLAHPESARRERARRALRTASPDSFERALRRAAELPEPVLVELLALARTDPRPSWVEPLGALAGHPSRRIRTAVARLLGERGVVAAADAREVLLVHLLDDPDGGVRTAALEALGAVDRPVAADALARWLDASPGAPAWPAAWRTFAGLDSGRPRWLERFEALPSDAASEVRVALGEVLGRTALLERERGRLERLFGALAAQLVALDPEQRAAGERALADTARELTRAKHFGDLAAGLRSLIARHPSSAAPHDRLAHLVALEGFEVERLEEVLAAWSRARPDPRRPAGLDTAVQTDVLRGARALLDDAPARAREPLQRAVARLDAALADLEPWRDPWDGGHALDVRLGEVRSVPSLPSDELEEELLRRGERLVTPERPFDAVRRGYFLYRSRVLFLLAFARALEGTRPNDAAFEDLLRDAYETAALDVFRLSVSLRGASLGDPDRFPDFGESLDLVFEGELGLYDVARRCLQGRPGERVVGAMLALLDGVERLGPWAAAEIGTPGAAAEASRRPRAREFLMRYPSRVRIWLAQWVLDELGDTARAEKLFEHAARGLAEQAGTWPGAARLAATAHHGRGSCAIQAREGERAVAILLAAIADLEAFQRSYEARLGAGSARWLDPDLAAMYVSVAVTQNVLLGRPEVAQASMERALALDPTDFNVVLHACYLARAGRTDAARRSIERVPRAPDLYYNLACTHALLGDREKGLAFLELDLTTNYPTAAGRRQQEVWAWSDPDLESLRAEPRFRALCGAPPQ